MRRSLHLFFATAMLTTIGVLALAACNGAPSYCDQCDGKAWACQNTNGDVSCYNTEDEAASSACSAATHDIGKCE